MPTVEYVPTLLAQLDRAGLADAMPTARQLLARRAQLVADVATRQAGARQHLAQLVQDIAHDELPLADAVAAAVPLTPWLAITPSDAPRSTVAEMLALAAADELQRATLPAVIADAPAVYAQLVELAGVAVIGAHQASRGAVDLGAIVDRLRQLIATDEADSRDRPGDIPTLTVAGPMEPGSDHAHALGGRLPSVDVAALQRNARTAAAWASAASHTSTYGELAAAARALRETTGRTLPDPAAALYGAPTTRQQRFYVEQLPVPLQLAVAVELGMRPGLYGAELFPVPERVGLVERGLATVGAALAPQG